MESTDFAFDLWARDLERLTAPGHRRFAQRFFDHATETLGSPVWQRASSREGPSDCQTIFRTVLHRAFWAVLDTRVGHLRFYFPDKYDRVTSIGPYPAVPSLPRKKEKVVEIHAPIEPRYHDTLLAGLEAVLLEAVDYYSRARDSSDTLRILFGPAGQPGTPLTVPEISAFASLLAEPRCPTCGTSIRLSLWPANEGWRTYCDVHHPMPSAYARLAPEVIPYEVRGLVWQRDGGRCVNCGATNFITFDHIIPANRGGGRFTGSNTETNIRLKCRACNFSKGNKRIP